MTENVENQEKQGNDASQNVGGNVYSATTVYRGGDGNLNLFYCKNRAEDVEGLDTAFQDLYQNTGASGTLENTANLVTNHTKNSEIHVTEEEKAQWSASSETLAPLLENLPNWEQQLSIMESQIEQIIAGIYYDMTTNPWNLDFSENEEGFVEGVDMTSGVWDNNCLIW